MNCEAIGPPLTVVRGNCDRNSDWPLVVDLARESLNVSDSQHIPPERCSGREY